MAIILYIYKNPGDTHCLITLKELMKIINKPFMLGISSLGHVETDGFKGETVEEARDKAMKWAKEHEIAIL